MGNADELSKVAFGGGIATAILLAGVLFLWAKSDVVDAGGDDKLGSGSEIGALAAAPSPSHTWLSK